MERMIQRAIDEFRQDAAEREARIVQTIYIATGLILAGLAIASGLIIAFV